MNVHSIDLVHFMSHDKTKLELPARGVVAITGVNGAGKSAFVEAVGWCFWGKTMRGTSPWRGDGKPPCVVEVTSDRAQAARKRTGAKSELTWAPIEEDAPEVTYETATKSQEALEQQLGCGFDLWRKSHVFSSADAAHFTAATDGERKRLIESFLGTTRFDAALEECRKDLKAATEKLGSIERAKEVAEAKLHAARTRLDEAKKGLAANKVPDAVAPTLKPGKPLDALDQKIGEAKRELRQLQNKRLEQVAAGGEHEAAVRQAEQLLAKLKAATCPTCTQSIDPAFRKRIAGDADAAKAKANAAKNAVKGAVDELKALIEECEDGIDALSKKRAARAQEIASIERAKAEAARIEKARAILEKSRREADEAVFSLTEELEGLFGKEAAARTDVGELVECEKVLGLKGVRAHIVGEALGGIEAVANAWLGMLHEKQRIKLSPYSEKKTGGVSDSISMEVVGVGDGKGYKANSGGERRRLDVALLLALAEVSAAAHGAEIGTLWFDEVFDWLDDDGVASVAEALSQLAEKRCVVVITHSKSMLEKLRGARRLHVEGGKATWL